MNNWEDFWLNEGFAVFVERYVLTNLEDVNYALTEAFVGNNALSQQNTAYGATNTYASIHPVLQGDNPDNMVSIVPFEKGF
jgi:leukotriene-A4 hydrolase